MNKMQWHSWGAIFLVLALTLMMIHVVIVGTSNPDVMTWAVARMYFLAVWFSFAAAVGCIASAYYSDFKEGAAKSTSARHVSGRKARSRSRR